jgi:5'/3'-nucleotidase
VSAAGTVLVTNDDGVESPGLAALVRGMAGAGRQVVVAAPSSDQSGTSAAVAPRPAEGVHVERLILAGLEDVVSYAFSVDGPPALAVLAARLGELGEAARSATVVASGVNLGQNTGAAVLFSGTVGAALAAANVGLSALAVSIASMAPRHLDTATAVSAADRPPDRLAGVCPAPLAAFGQVEVAARERDQGPFTIQLRVAETEPPPDSDMGRLRAGWVTVTPLLGVRADVNGEVASFIERALSRAA